MAFLLLAPLRCVQCRHRFYRPWYVVKRVEDGDFSVAERREVTFAVVRESKPAAEVSPSVLVLEDDAALRKLLTRLLTREGYGIREASDAGSAKRALEAGGIEVLITHLRDRNQMDMVRGLQAADPRLKVVALSPSVEAPELSIDSQDGRLLILPLLAHPHEVVDGLKTVLASRSQNTASSQVTANG